MVTKALSYRNKTVTREGKRKTSTADDRNIVRYCTIYAFAPAKSIREELNLAVNTATVRR